MTRILYDPDAFRLEVRGHAGAGAAGNDLVCAGISALTFALLNAAADDPSYMAHVYTCQQDAVIWVQCYPDEAEKIRCAEMFRTILHGYETIRESNPDNIEIVIGGYDG